jgi:predicted nucleic acid-binding protein
VITSRPALLVIPGPYQGSPGSAGEVQRAGRPVLPMYQATALSVLGEVFAVVIDTSVITSDVISTVKHGLPSPLYLAMRTGLVRGFMAHHTWAEVPRVLAKRASREGIELAAAEKLWWGSYVKLIRFVPTGDLPPGDPDFERALRARDPSDLPTVTLASLIAPVVVLATDPDLKDIGLAYERWWEVPEAIRKMVAGHGSTDLAARAIFGAGYGTVALIRSAARALRNPWVAGVVAGIAAVAAATHRRWYPQVREWAEQTSPGARRAAGSFARALLGTFEQYWAAAAIWSSAQRGRAGRTLLHQVARLLATSPGPMTRTEIAAHLRAEVSERGHRAIMADLSTILEGHQAFCPVTRSRWQLGKEDANLATRSIA